MKTNRRGMVLITFLWVALIVIMLTGVLLTRGHQGLFQSSHYRDSVRAAQAAAGGANHVITLFENDINLSAPIRVDLDTNCSYEIHFDDTQPNHSVNNLTSNTESATLNFRGETVPAFTADVVIVARCGLSQRAVRVIIQSGFQSLRSVAAVGKVSLQGRCSVNGVQSLYPPAGTATNHPAPGGILSKYRSAGPGDYAVEWSGSSFVLSPMSKIETAPSLTGSDPVSPSLRSAWDAQIVDNGAADQIPDIDVPSKVAAGSGSPAPLGLAPLGPGFGLGTTYIADERYVNGNLVVDGDLVFSDGTLYVNGDLTVNGGFEGLGSLFVTGNITVNGGNTVVQTNQPSGAAIMAGGDVNLVGISAAGHLDTLVASNPILQTPYDRVMTELGYYQGGFDSRDFHDAATRLSTHYPGYDNPAPGDNYWISPIPGPDGTHNVAYDSGLLPKLILDIKALPTYGVDPRDRRVVGALEEMQYHFRLNRNNCPPFFNAAGVQEYVLNPDYTLDFMGSPLTRAQFENNPPPLGHRTDAHDDQHLPAESWCHDTLGFPNQNHNIGWGQTGPSVNNDVLHRNLRTAFLEAQPTSFNWLGKSSFQGILYSRGDIHVDKDFRITGSVISLGDVSFTNGAALVFNEEYRKLFGRRLPVSVLHYEEI